MKFETSIGEIVTEINIEPEDQEVALNESSKEYSFHTQPNGRHLLRIGTKLYKIDNVEFEKHTVRFSINGHWCSVDVRDEQDLLMDEMGFKTAADIGEGQLKAPMPGKILEIMVEQGDEVELGEPVAILEAMKMENELKAPVAGVVTSITAEENDSLEKNALILEIEASG